MRPSQNLPLPPRLYPAFQQLYATLPDSTPPSKNISLLSTTICDPHRIYPSLQDYTLLFNNYMRPYQNLLHPPKIYLPFQQLYPTLPESTPLSQNISPFSTTICDPLGIYPSLSEYIPFSTTIILCDPPESTRPSQNIAPFQQLYATLPESTPPSQNIPPFSTTILLCDAPRIWEGLGGSQNHTVFEKGGRFWEAGVDSGRVAHINWLKRGVYSGRKGIFWEGRIKL